MEFACLASCWMMLMAFRWGCSPTSRHGRFGDDNDAQKMRMFWRALWESVWNAVLNNAPVGSRKTVLIYLNKFHWNTPRPARGELPVRLEMNDIGQLNWHPLVEKI